MPVEAAPTDPPIPTLSLRPHEAAKALGISARSLWAMTAANAIPHVRLGRMILYPTDSLRRFLDERAAAQAEGGSR